MAIYKIVQIKSNGLNVYIVIITVFVFIASGIVGSLDVNRNSGVMVSVLASNVVDRGF